MKRIISIVCVILTLSIFTIKYEIKSKNDNATILFIGNSLTYVGKISEQFKDLTEQEGKNNKIFAKTDPNYKLSQHLYDLTNGGYESMISKVDIVIFQEYGAYGIDTANSIIELQKLFPDKTEFCFLLTEFDVGGRMLELKDVPALTYIPSGYVHNTLLENGYIYDQLHNYNDFHPNELYGYIAALTVYSTIFEESCEDIPYEYLKKSTKSLVPGLSDEKKEKSLKYIEKKIMEEINTERDITD